MDWEDDSLAAVEVLVGMSSHYVLITEINRLGLKTLNANMTPLHSFATICDRFAHLVYSQACLK